jgi:hypothetical protein
LSLQTLLERLFAVHGFLLIRAIDQAEEMKKEAWAKSYNTRDSLVVTDPTTSLA